MKIETMITRKVGLSITDRAIIQASDNRIIYDGPIVAMPFGLTQCRTVKDTEWRIEGNILYARVFATYYEGKLKDVQDSQSTPA